MYRRAIAGEIARGLSMHKRSRLHFVRGTKEEAARVAEEAIDLAHNDASCRGKLLRYLKIENGTIPYYNKAEKRLSQKKDLNVASDYTKDFRQNDLVRLNQLDIELYEFAKELIDFDCEFYAQVEDSYLNIDLLQRKASIYG